MWYNKPMTHRLFYPLATLLTIIAGLLSRRLAFLPSEVGDALWAVMVYLILRTFWQGKWPSATARLALVISFLVEFSQLLTWDWLVRFRLSLLGHLLLGQGFLVRDLIAYTIGISLITYIDTNWIRRSK